jgi:hypothetical protein
LQTIFSSSLYHTLKFNKNIQATRGGEREAGEGRRKRREGKRQMLSPNIGKFDFLRYLRHSNGLLC